MKYIDADKLIAILERQNVDKKVIQPLIRIIDSLSEEPDRPEPYTGKYDEAYLDEKIKKATEHWKGVDVDKMLAECRGYDEQPDKSLEEAADKYSNENEYMDVGFCVEPVYIGHKIEKAFIAGAEWQKQQDLAEMAQSKSPLSVAYANRCFENGKKAMKEQMLKDAIYYVVQDDLDSHGASYNIPFIRIGTTALKPKGIGVGDKVKVIVLKAEEK